MQTRGLTSGTWSAALLGAAVLLLAACGGGEKRAAPSESPTAPAGTALTTPASTQVVLPTPATTPVITGNLFEYPERGYSVRFPEGWSARPGIVAQPLVVADAFFEPGPEGQLRANISVACQPVEEGLTEDTYFEGKLALFEALSGSRPEAQAAQIGGVEARRVEYASGQGPAAVEKVDVIFLSEKCGWTISLVTPPGKRADYRPLLDAFLASFALLPAP